MPSRKSNTATPFCKLCYQNINESSLAAFLGEEIPICQRCYQAISPAWHRFFLDEIKCYDLYPYNEELKTIIFNLKACGDIEIAPLLLGYAKPFLRLRFKGYVLVPAPSFKTKNDERGFNHVVEIYRPLGLPIVSPIVKTDDVKQSSLGYKKRQLIGNHLAYKGEELYNQKVLFVDDICTTGATIKACARLLLEHGAKSVSALVVARTTMKGYPYKAGDCIKKTIAEPFPFLQKALAFWKKKGKT